MILLRIEMPDRPGSLGRVATAIASSGADIASIRIVGRADPGTVVDDFVCELPPGAWADTLVSSFDESIGAKVLWVSRCPDQWDVLSESELVSAMATDSARARELLFQYAPMLFHCQWSAATRLHNLSLILSTDHAPELTPEHLAALEPLDQLHQVELSGDWAPGWGEVTVAVVPSQSGWLAILGRQGGPPFLEPELRRLSRLVSMLP